MKYAGLQSAVLKAVLLGVILPTVFLAGAVKVEAATSVLWYTREANMPQQTCTSAYVIVGYVNMITGVTYPVSSTIKKTYPIEPITRCVLTRPVVTYYTLSPWWGFTPFGSGTLGKYYASINKTQFIPGETGSISVSTTNGLLSQQTCAIFGSWCTTYPQPYSLAKATESWNGKVIVNLRGRGSASGTGTFTVPTALGNYTINLQGCYASLSDCDTNTLSISVVAPPPIVTFNSSNKTISLGQSVTYSASATDKYGTMDQLALNWKNPDGTYNWTNPPGTNTYQAITSSGPYFTYSPTKSSASFSLTMTPTTVGTYSVYAVAHNLDGWGYSPKYTLTVKKPLPTATLSVSPLIIDSGQSVKVTWSSTNATSCTTVQGSFSTGGKTSGTVSTGPLTTNTLYQVSCTGPIGTTKSNIQQVTVRVPTVSLSASPSRVAKGKLVTLSWNATNINSCTITKNGSLWKNLTANANRTVSGTATDTITAQTIYKMTCTNNASVSAVASTQIVNVAQTFSEF